jgi:glycosyltransferase involved in cell wall biosynthesis
MDKKIYVNGTILHETPTGLGVYAKNILKVFAKDKRPVKVFSPIPIKGLEVIEVTKYVKPSYKKKGGIVRLLYTQLVIPFKIKKGDILYHPFQYLSLLASGKQIITIHDLIPLYYPEVAKHQYKYYKYFMPLLLKKAHKVICISENTKEDLLKFYNIDESKVKMIYNGYDKELFNEENVNEETLKKYNIDYPYMVMVGASYPHKNLDSAIKAFKELKDKKGSKLIIIGKTCAYIEKLVALTKKLNLQSEVIFLGYVEDEDLKTLYNKSKAFVYPTLYEGFGLPILEAAACDTLVLCSNNSCLPEVAGDGAIMFNPESIEEIREAMEKAIEGGDFIEEIKKKAKENLKRFSWEKTGREIFDLISEE